MFTHYTYTQLKSIGVHLSPGSEVIPSNNIHDYNVSAYSFIKLFSYSSAVNYVAHQNEFLSSTATS